MSIITRKTVRKIFPPLAINLSTKVHGPLDQIYESMFNRWTPDRSKGTEFHLVIQPQLYVTSNVHDNTWQDGLYTGKMTNIRWFANGERVEDVFNPNEFEVVLDSYEGDRGTLVIKKNLLPGTHYDLVMTAELLDTRTSEKILLQTDIVPIGVSEITADEWDLSVVHDINIVYHPLFDKLKEFDWKYENGKITDQQKTDQTYLAQQRELCYDGNEYLLNMPVIISKGNAVLQPDNPELARCSLEMSVIKNGKSYVIQPEECIFLRELAIDHVLIDQRYIPDMTVLKVNLKVGGVTMGSEYMTFSYTIDPYTCEPSNEGGIGSLVLTRPDRAICSVNGVPMDYPSAYLDIKWYTEDFEGNLVQHDDPNNPDKDVISIDMKNVNIGTGTNAYMQVLVESSAKTMCDSIQITKDPEDQDKVVVIKGNNPVVYIPTKLTKN